VSGALLPLSVAAASRLQELLVSPLTPSGRVKLNCNDTQDQAHSQQQAGRRLLPLTSLSDVVKLSRNDVSWNMNITAQFRAWMAMKGRRAGDVARQQGAADAKQDDD
jgi:hypothetical protein